MSRIKYPKLLLLILTFIIAAIFFNEAKTYPEFNSFLISLGYVGTFLAVCFTHMDLLQRLPL